jgi:hypothetical protein
METQVSGKSGAKAANVQSNSYPWRGITSYSTEFSSSIGEAFVKSMGQMSSNI